MNRYCPSCGNNGEIIHQNVGDYFFGHEGEWSFYKCGREKCGLVWIDPLPSPDELPKFYYDYYTHDASGLKAKLKSQLIAIMAPVAINPSSAQKWRRAIALMVKSFYPRVASEAFYGLGSIAPFGERRMLDIGCGNGERLPLFAAVGWSQVAGVDVDPDAIQSAQALGREVKLGSMDSIPYSSGSFDFLFLHHVVEHVYSVEEGLQECFRVLRPGGKVYLLTPNANSRLHRYYGKYWRGLEAPRHLRIHTMGSLRHALCKAGFIEEKLDVLDRSHDWLSQECVNAMLENGSAVSHPEMPELNSNNGEELLILGRKP